MTTEPRKTPLKKKADMIKYTKDKVKMSAYLDEWEKISKKRKGPSALDTLKSVSPLAAAGLVTGLGKGFVEEGITRRVASSMKKRKNPWLSRRAHEIGRGAGKGLTGAIATVLLGLATQKMIKSQRKARKR